jgi:hypothetical protein
MDLSYLFTVFYNNIISLLLYNLQSILEFICDETGKNEVFNVEKFRFGTRDEGVG